jgi:hypothetical protein
MLDSFLVLASESTLPEQRELVPAYSLFSNDRQSVQVGTCVMLLVISDVMRTPSQFEQGDPGLHRRETRSRKSRDLDALKPLLN